MQFLVDLSQLIFQYIPLGFLLSLALDPMVGTFMVLVVAMVWFQALRQARMEERLWGVVKNPPLTRTGTAIVYGVLGGLMGSLLLGYIGVPFTESGGDFLYLWTTALALSLVHPRFVCFSYAAGLLGLSSLLFGWPGVAIPQLIALVAVLHLVEAVMVWIDGGASATPTIVRRPGGDLVGGFSLQRFWPVPLTLLLAVSQISPGGETIATPGWWPLIRIPGPLGANPDAILALVPVVAGVGYADVALAESTRAKTRRSALHLALYAATLLGLALLADRSAIAVWAAVLFSPLGHEWVVQKAARREKNGRAYWQRPEHGALVLDVLPGTPAAAAGLTSGSLILAVDGQPVTGRNGLREALTAARAYCQIQYQGPSDPVPVTRRLPAAVRDDGEMGLILVPEPDDSPVMVMVERGPLGRWLARMTERLRLPRLMG